MPKVSVHIPCYNSEKYILETIKSVLDQTFADFELIIVNDGSSDKTEEIIKGFHDSRIRYFSQGNKGLAATRNRTLSLSNGEYIAFLDHDDLWLPAKLEKQVAALDASPDAALAYSNFYRLFPDGDRILAFRKNQPEGKIFESVLREYSVGLSTVIIRKRHLDELKICFDEKLRQFEEYDLFMKLLYRYEAAYIKEPLAVYRIHDARSSILFKDIYADEFEYVVKKMMDLEPGFAVKYSKALKRVMGNIGQVRAKVAMEKLNRKDAREYLAPHIWSGNKFLALYLLTFFPAAVWNRIHDIKNRGFLL